MADPSDALLLDLGSEPSILIRDGRIAELGADPAAAPEARRLDCRGARVRPGAVNAHTHLYSGLVPLGMPPPSPPPETFVQILERVWWRLDRALDEASLRAAARFYMAEALLSGTTTLVDHHESPRLIDGSLDVLADAAEELGVRLVTCYGATERNGGREEARAGLSECARFVRDGDRPLVRGLVGLHASFTVSDDTVREAGELAREIEVPLHLHLAEGAADVQDARERGHPGVLDRLLSLGALPPGSVLAHGVHLTEDEVRRAEGAGCWLVHNPRSNDNNGVGYARALHASRHVALGTDGFPADMDAELEAAIRLAGEHGEPAGAEGCRRRAAAGRKLAAERFGVTLQDELAAGDAADLVVWDDGGNGEGTPPRCRHVVVNGRVVVEDGRLTGADASAIRAEAERQAGPLWERMAEL